MKEPKSEKEAAVHAPQWYAVHLHSNFEAMVSEILERSLQGDSSVFYAHYFVKSTRRGKEHLIKKPLFPGYVFIKTSLAYSSKVRILSVRGVSGLVSFGGRPAAIEESVIASLKLLTGRSGSVAPHPYIKDGTRVRVTGGPLAGATGIVLKSTGRRARFIISVNILKRSVGVTIDPAFLEPDI
ncbi:MAG: transcription termination/antitermination NusG family protein [Pseudomonadota bacterium]